MVRSNIPKSSAYWHFRINDLSEEQLQHLKMADTEWIVIGEIEIGDIAKGQHYHCAIKFKRSYEFTRVKKMLVFNQSLIKDLHFWLEPKYPNSTIQQFIQYCIKNGCRYKTIIYEQLGAIEPEQSGIINTIIPDNKEDKKKELSILRQQHAECGNIEWFRDNDFKFMCSAEFQRLLVWAQPDATKCIDKLDNYFIWGASGEGKSSSIEFLYPDCYRKIKNNEKWDNYFNLKLEHETVYFDELDDMESIEKCCGGYEGLKTMAEVYPFAVRQNYGNRQLMIRPKRIIISSNYTPSQLFATPNKYGRVMPHLEIVLKTFHRKFKVVHISEWQKMNNIRFNRDTQRTEWLTNGTFVTVEEVNNVEMNMEDTRYWDLSLNSSLYKFSN